MRIPIAAGNWKLNYGPQQTAEFLLTVRGELELVQGVTKLVFPPYISVSAAANALTGSVIQVGVQDVSEHAQGAYTGEVSAMMAAELCSWTIIGHSERRMYHHETDEMTHTKILRALEAGLSCIVCVGEQLAQREAGVSESVVAEQIQRGLVGLPAEKLGEIVIAYEPVWAIGTGRAASRADAEAMALMIRSVFADLYGASAAQALRILYGGSATAANIASFMESPEIDGALVGGASLKPEFTQISRIIADARA